MFVINTQHQSNIVGTQGVHSETLGLDSLNVGTLRDSGEIEVNKEALVTNMALDIIKNHKKQNKSIEVSYVCLDESDNLTEDESNITSVQFEVKILGKNNRVESISNERVEFSQLEGG